MNNGIDRALSMKLDPIKVSPMEHEKMMMNITRKNQKLHFPCRLSLAVTIVLICFVLTASALAVTLSIIEARKQWESEKGEMRFWSIEDQTQFLQEYGDEPVPSPKDNVDQRVELIDTAKEALCQKYGISIDELSAYTMMERYDYNETTLGDGTYTFTWVSQKTENKPLADLYSVTISAEDHTVLQVESSFDMAGATERVVDWRGIKEGDTISVHREIQKNIPVLSEPWLPYLPSAEEYLTEGTQATVIGLYDAVQAIIPDNLGLDEDVLHDLWLHILYVKDGNVHEGYILLDYAVKMENE
ncbi:MAG: hypothetical protein IK099_05250 [Clostridia bacterium]|nr:hypothetical protein [Clostridia bacterium]